MITHPEKVLFPDDGITKGELAGYYESIAPVMLPHLRRRPVTMERYPAGIGKKGFWQKDVSKGFPEWLKRIEVPKKGGTVHHPLVNDARTLLWAANQNTITPHVWVSRVPKLHYPDVCVFDLDPSDEEDLDALRAAALGLRELLNELGLPSWVKTSGSKGFHIVALARRTIRDRRGRAICAQGGHDSGEPRSAAADAGIQQGRSWRTDSGRYRPQRLQRHVCRRLRRAGKARSTCLGAMHVGRDRTRHGRAADVYAADDGGSDREGGRPVVGHADAQASAATGNREAGQDLRWLIG